MVHSTFQLNDKDDESISEAESDIQEADLQVANDIFGSTENLPTDAKEDQGDIIDEHNDDIVSNTICIIQHEVKHGIFLYIKVVWWHSKRHVRSEGERGYPKTLQGEGVFSKNVRTPV